MEKANEPIADNAPAEHWEVVVIGAGAAGLLAATRAAERGRRTLLLEKNRKPGVKILISGGTRCNLTQNTDRRGIVTAYGRQGPFLHSALAALGPAELVALVEAEGVPTKIESTGKIFPLSDRAVDVLGAFLARFGRSGAVLSGEEAVMAIERQTAVGFRLTTTRRTILADKLIVTTGGQSYPGCGTTGDAYAWARSLGHTIVAPRPALVPITTAAEWVKQLQGLTIPDVGLKVIEREKGSGVVSAFGGADSRLPTETTPDPFSRKKPRCLAERRGSLLFAHFGLSGPVALDVSREVSGHPRPNTLTLECDFLPNIKEGSLDELLQRSAAALGKKQLAAIFPEEVPRRLAEALLQQAGIASEGRAAELSKSQRNALVQSLKRLAIPVAGTRGFAKAEVTAGGVALGEVDSSTMQSKLVPNLYWAGEVLDLDGPIGGYNFQAAFSTGFLAGESV